MQNNFLLSKINLNDSCVIKLFFVLFLFFTTLVSAEENDSKTALLKTYSELLSKVDHDRKKDLFHEGNIAETINLLLPVKVEATHCVTKTTQSLEKIKADILILGDALQNESAEVKRKRRDLNAEAVKAEKQLSSCRVMILKSEEALKDLSAKRQDLMAVRLLAKSANIIQLLGENWNKSSVWIESTRTFLSDNSGLTSIETSDILVFSIIVITAFFISASFRRRMINWTNHHPKSDTLSSRFTRAFMSVAAYYMPHLLVSTSAAIFCYVMTSDVSPVPFLCVIAYGLPLFFVAFALIELILDPRKPAVSFHNISDMVSTALSRRLKVFILLLFIGYLLFTTILAQSFPVETYLLARCIFAIIFVANLIWAVWILGKMPAFLDTVILRIGFTLILLSLLVAEILGYRNLSAYAIRTVLGTLTALGVVVFLSGLMSELFDGLDHGAHRWQRKIRESLGVKTHAKISGLAWARFFTGAILWFVFIIIILGIWGLSQTGFEYLKNLSFEGFDVGSMKIIPSKIFLALIVFFVLLAISRWFRTRLERTWLSRTRMERGAREATATISGYTGVAIAIFIALSISGVELTSLALIAGALSVGIGFGLQNIVNNFVSGLILLFERPVKTGDWIIVGGTEGYVRRISIRSTQIQTFDQADVIVPNSELISGQVTNLMLRDVRGRIRVPVGVAYGSDTLLVRDLMLEVARQNSFVVTDGSSPEPKVLFMEFGDSALLFELRVFIENIDAKYQATSDINFAIDAVFREHDIQIPFPQRDLHLKSGFETLEKKDSGDKGDNE